MDTVKNAVNTLLGRKPTGPKVRYGVVAAGWISQSSFMPGVGQTSNSGMKSDHRSRETSRDWNFILEMTVLVSDDAEKRNELGKEYKLKAYSYDQFPLVLESGECDAFYIATPNNMHRQFTVPALEKGLSPLSSRQTTSARCSS